MVERILVTGGAGYIGCHVVKELLKKNRYHVTVLDNLSRGYADSVTGAKLIIGDISDQTLLSELFRTESFTAVMHLAAQTSVPESIQLPLSYYETNTMGTLSLLKASRDAGVPHFIFSSTAAVYGLPQQAKVDEKTPTLPTTPYGRSKAMAEQMLCDFAQINPTRYIILRYFNVAGADPEGQLGQRSELTGHLIKVALEAAYGRRKSMPIFGVDYPTKDGTCIRDFVHVSDIAKAHVDALDYLKAGGASTTLNCGYGQGYSVQEVVKAVEQVVGKPIVTEYVNRRAGDSPCVIAKNEKIKALLGWKPQYNDLAFMIQTAHQWESKFS